MPSAFTPEAADAIARARQHSVGDLLRRTALRYPDKLAVVSGDRRALLSRNCWEFAVLVFATAKLGVVLVPVSFMLGDVSLSASVRRRPTAACRPPFSSAPGTPTPSISASR